MTNSTDMAVRGKAVYLEFVKPGITTQVLIMPEGMSTSHKNVPMTVYRRRLTVTQPRKTWKQAASAVTSFEVLAATETSLDEKSNRLLGFMMPLFHSLETNKYTLFNQPIVVEVTAEDLEASRLGKTPYKAMARVWKSRKALGFPKEYLHVPV